MTTLEDEMREALDGTFVAFDLETGMFVPRKVSLSYYPAYVVSANVSEYMAAKGRAGAKVRFGARILTMDQRHWIQELRAQGISTKTIAEVIGCTTSLVRHWYKPRRIDDKD